MSIAFAHAFSIYNGHTAIVTAYTLVRFSHLPVAPKSALLRRKRNELSLILLRHLHPDGLQIGETYKFM